MTDVQMYLEQQYVESLLLKHYLLAQGVANCPLHVFFYMRKSIWGTFYCVLYVVAGCLLWRGYTCMDLIGKTIRTQRFVRYIEVPAVEGCPLSGVSLYISQYQYNYIVNRDSS